MQLRTRPLLVDGVDADRYVSRPELERQLRDAVRAERNTLLIGAPGSGKTTLLRKLSLDLADAGVPVAWVDASLADSPIEFLQLVELALRSTSGDQGAIRSFMTVDPDQALPVQLTTAVAQLPTGQPTAVLVDGALADQVAYEIFGRLRDRLWTLPHTWVLATTPQRSGALRAEPAAAFWSAHVTIGEMGAEEIDELLRRGLDGDELARVQASPTYPLRDTPRRVIQLAHDLLDGTIAGNEQPARRREGIAARLGRPESMALAELEALGRPATASDDELLARLGWKRPYTGRVLTRLEDAGVVRSFPAPREGQGRPAKLYEPNPEI
jgi:hypothetical protein